MRINVSKYFMFLVLTLLILLQSPQAKADDHVMVDDAYACMFATSKLEKKYQIQEHLLTTISSVETGRWDATKRHNVAWPWTVNSQGKGTFYKSKAEAIEAVKKLQAKGIKSIDVGCMQINLYYHPDAFANLEEAFDPQKNVEYSAKFLKNLYVSRGNDWIKAAMAYHSSAPEKAQRYKKKIVSTYEIVKQAQNQQKEKSIAMKPEPKPQVLAAVQAQKELKTIRRSQRFSPNPAREARLVNDATAWREAKLAEYRQRKTASLQ